MFELTNRLVGFALTKVDITDLAIGGDLTIRVVDDCVGELDGLFSDGDPFAELS